METIRNILLNIWGLVMTVGQTVSFWDIIDIVLIAYLIYKILSVMRRTSSGSIIKGIVFILAVVWLANLLELKVVSYLLGAVMQMGIVIVVVLFQPELRKFFEQMGSRNLNVLFKRRVKLENVEQGIRHVVAASEVMAKSKTGAIIVFERDVGLSDYAATGTRIDADISSELLQNIFYHNSPLHDGAVIISDGRILAASCMLPLSNNVNLSRELGMRHRAGIGISERSDAVVVITSEETGSVSVAVDGMLKRHLAKDTFEKLLKNELLANESVKEEKPRRLKVKK